MKKNLFILSALVLIFVNTSFSQFSAGFTNTGNILTFKIKPNIAKTTGFSVMEFFVRYPTGSAPFTYGPVVANTTSFPGMTALGTLSSGSWEIERNNPAYVVPGFNVDHIFYTAPAPTTTVTTYNADQVYDVLSVAIIGAPATINFELVHQNTEASFYLALTSDLGADLRPALLTNYFFPTTLQAAGPLASVIYYAGLTVPLPVKFLGFNVTKRNNDAMLTWKIENEDAQTDRYEVERSLNGVDFKFLNTVAPKNNGNSSNSYDLTDLNLTDLRSAGVFYYRIKQIDKDGRFIYSAIKSVRFTSKGIVIGIYPNPLRNTANLTIDLEQDTDASITINDAAGKQVQNFQMQLLKGLNTKKINLGALAAGSYMLKVQTPTEIKTISVVKTN